MLRDLHRVGIMFIGLVAMSFLGFGCQSGESGSIRQISAEEFKGVLDRDSSVALIDVRTQEEYEQVRVPHIKARIEYQDIAAQIDTTRFPKDLPVYLICRSGRRSLVAAKELSDLGYRQPINIAGGTLAWEKAGYPTIKR